VIFLDIPPETVGRKINFPDVHGQIPEDKELMYETIEEALGWPITAFLKEW